MAKAGLWTAHHRVLFTEGALDKQNLLSRNCHPEQVLVTFVSAPWVKRLYAKSLDMGNGKQEMPFSAHAVRPLLFVHMLAAPYLRASFLLLEVSHS